MNDKKEQTLSTRPFSQEQSQSTPIKQAVPTERPERQRLHTAITQYVAEHSLVPPLDMKELREHTQALALRLSAPAAYYDFILLQLSNATWADTVARVPFSRRVLIMPQCLRDRRRCQAKMDEFGLLCAQCGACAIGRCQEVAESLGYVVLVAEGTTVVVQLLESGAIDAVIGVSCLDVLERTFPHMAAEAIPGMAIPLLNDGCEDTLVDEAELLEVIRFKSGERHRQRLDFNALRQEVDQWFTAEQLSRIIGKAEAQTEEIARSWLAISGKRWRPLLAVCVYRTITEGEPTPNMLRHLAIAVECFHKASLIHDDIEDNDDFRYGDMTLHRRHGLPVALNTGDFLLGEGYRLIGESGAPPEAKARMLNVAAEGHRTLCLGQGAELLWTRHPQPLSSAQVLEIFRQKTAPAFEVAVRLGAIAAGSNAEICLALKQFSESLGIAYQIRDDLDDFLRNDAGNDLEAMRPSLLLTLGWELSTEAGRKILEPVWKRRLSAADIPRIRQTVQATDAIQRAHQLIEHHKNKALRALGDLRNSDLKTLLHRVTRRIISA